MECNPCENDTRRNVSRCEFPNQTTNNTQTLALVASLANHGHVEAWAYRVGAPVGAQLPPTQSGILSARCADGASVHLGPSIAIAGPPQISHVIVLEFLEK